jgi:hypothetical protein
MLEEQVGNASIDSNDAPESSFDESDFFSQLDQGVNGGILEAEQTDTQTTFQQEGDNTQSNESPIGNEVQQSEDVENLKQRYADSSKEGKRLNQRLKELEPYLPVLDAMRDDSNLVSHVRDYFQNGGDAPKSMTEKLNLGDDFIFDPDDAVSDPNSDSAKVLNSTIDGVVQRRLRQGLEEQRTENEQMRTRNDFRQSKNMNDAEWNDFVSFSESHTLSLDDIYFLKNRGARESNIASNAGRQATEQIKNVQGRPKSLATAGSAKIDASSDDVLFDAIMGIDKQLDNAFG